MKILYREKKHLILYCTKSMREEELECEKKAIKLIEDFQGKKKHKLRKIENDGDEIDHVLDDFEKELLDLVDELEDNLMEIEMKLQDALYNSVISFKEKIQAFNNDMKSKTINFIKFVVEESEGFSDRIRDAALKDHDDFVAKLDADDGDDFLADENMSEEQQMYIDIMADRDVLVQLLDNSKEFFEQGVNQKESQITKAIAKD